VKSRGTISPGFASASVSPLAHYKFYVGEGEWQLFNIVDDPGETVDVSASQALRFQRMLSRYEQYRDAIIVFLLTLLMLLPFYVGYRMKSE
jgi:hypothetical protein